MFGAEGAFDPADTRAVPARFEAPVLLLAGEVDVSGPPRVMGEFAALFPYAELVVQAGAGHFPWLDGADRFARTTATFPGWRCAAPRSVARRGTEPSAPGVWARAPSVSPRW
ncbi:alpha/beta fold hydrolase [Embleya sp. NPDC050154]|uniref:alpha/beta fold hydrolase n=1 Tax=unclassified Embleya TaxID=2699296 RepID=UPI0037B9C869